MLYRKTIKLRLLITTQVITPVHNNDVNRCKSSKHLLYLNKYLSLSFVIKSIVCSLTNTEGGEGHSQVSWKDQGWGMGVSCTENI